MWALNSIFCTTLKRIANGFVCSNPFTQFKYGGFIGCEINEGMHFRVSLKHPNNQTSANTYCTYQHQWKDKADQLKKTTPGTSLYWLNTAL